MEYLWLIIQLLFYLLLYILIWLLCLSPLIVLYIGFRFTFFRAISYLFARIRFRTKNIFVCSYNYGFNNKYEDEFNNLRLDFSICYLFADESAIWICPIYRFIKRSSIPYNKIINVFIRRDSDENVSDQLPKEMKTVDEMIIHFTAEDGTKDILSVSLYSYYAFNKYSFKKSDVFQYISQYVPKENFLQGDYKARDTIIKSWKKQ